MLTLLRRLFLSLLLLALGAAAALRFASTKSSRPAPIHSTGLTIEQVQQLADLVVLKVEVSDVMECRIDGWTGGVQGALIVQGDVQLATDLSQARFVSMNGGAHRHAAAVPAEGRPPTCQPRWHAPVFGQHPRPVVARARGQGVPRGAEPTLCAGSGFDGTGRRIARAARSRPRPCPARAGVVLHLTGLAGDDPLERPAVNGHLASLLH